jgi:hypothetical protein
MGLSPELESVINTWQAPLGLIVNAKNSEVLCDLIAKHHGNVFSHEIMTNTVFQFHTQFAWEAGRSPSEAIKVWQEWVRFNPGIAPSQKNFGSLFAYIATYCGGIFTIPNFDLAASRVTLEQKKLDLNELAQRQAAQDARWRKQQEKAKLENSEDAFFERQRKAEQAEEKAKEKSLGDSVLKSECMRIITSFEVYTPSSRVDHSRSESGQATLMKILNQNKGNLKLALELIKQKAVELSNQASYSGKVS